MKRKEKVGPFSIRPHVRDGKQSGRWQLDIPPDLSKDGVRQRLSFDSKAEAKAEAERRYREELRPIPNRNRFHPRKSGITYAALAANWIKFAEESVEVKTLRRSTLEKNLYHLKPILKLLANVDVSEIDEDKLRSYQLQRMREGRKPSTINGEVATIVVLLNWARTRRWIELVPTAKQLPVERAKVVLPTPDEVAKIISLLPERLRALVLVFACTGFRSGEVFNLPWHHVDLEKGTFLIAAHRDWKPKNPNSRREYPFSEQAFAAIRALRRTGYYVFPGRKGDQPIDNFRKALSTAMKKFVAEGGRPLHVTPKTFRKAFTSWQAVRGTPEIVTQDLLGHVRGSRVTKEVYTHLPLGEYVKAQIVLPLQEQQTNAPQTDLATVGNTRRKRGKATL